jgi:hypothetical protein
LDFPLVGVNRQTPQVLAALSARLGASTVVRLLRTPEGRAQLEKLIDRLQKDAQRTGTDIAKVISSLKPEKMAACLEAFKKAAAMRTAGWLYAAGRCFDMYRSRV